MTDQQIEIIKQVEGLALNEIKTYSSPFMANYYNVANEAGLRLAKELGADEFIVQLGTRLMDVKHGEAMKRNALSEHVAMSVRASRDFLVPFNLPTETINKIVNCVEGHHKDVPWICPEAEIVANADCYKFLEVKNWLGYFMLLGERSSDIGETIKQAEAKLEEKWRILSLDICRNELESQYRLIKQIIAAAK